MYSLLLWQYFIHTKWKCVNPCSSGSSTHNSVDFCKVLILTVCVVYSWKVFMVLLWQCRWCSCAFVSVNTLADTCVEQYSQLGEQWVWITFLRNLNVAGIGCESGRMGPEGHGVTSGCELGIMQQHNHSNMIHFKICLLGSRTNWRCSGILHTSQTFLCDFYVKGCMLMLDNKEQGVISRIPGLSF